MRRVKLALLGGLVVVMGSALAVALNARQAGRASPHESVTETIDGSRITITYGRPYMRGRTIFGRLVPYGRVWCPGADESTTFDSARDVQMGTVKVPAGPHTIWILPTPDKWTLFVSSEPSGFHTNYSPSLNLGSLEMQKRSIDTPVEQLTFALGKNPGAPGGVMTMTWENTEVSVPFTVQ
jgi:hypothetical protein